MQIKRGDIYWVDGAVEGDPKKTRPMLVISNDEINAYMSCVICAKMTSRPQKEEPWRIQVRAKEASTVMLENIYAVPKERIRDLIRIATTEEMQRVDRGLTCALGLPTGDPVQDEERIRAETRKEIARKIIDWL